MELLTASYEDVISTLEDSNIELTRERDEQNEQLFTLNAQVIHVMSCGVYSTLFYSILLYSTPLSNTLSMATETPFINLTYLLLSITLNSYTHTTHSL